MLAPSLDGPCYLRTVHSAIDAMAAVALFLPAAAVGKLQPGIVASLPNTYDCTQTGKRRVELLLQDVCSNE